MCNPNEPINGNVGIERLANGDITPSTPTISIGLTKREHFALELAKAYASADYVANSGTPYIQIATWGIEMADELINQLNK